MTLERQQDLLGPAHPERPLREPAAADASDQGRFDAATRALVAVAVLVAGVDLTVAFGASAALPILLVCLPVALPALRRFPGAGLVLLLTATALASGVVLSELASAERSVDPVLRVQGAGLLLSGIGAFVLVLWGRCWLPRADLLVLFGSGGVLGALAQGRLDWKFDLAVPATILVLGLTERTGRRWLPVAGLLALGVVGAVQDTRSALAFSVLTALVAAWQRASSGGAALPRWFPAMVLAGCAFILYTLSTALLTGGYLGSELQDRSVRQVEASGSLLAGGRPEWAATRELALARPQGYGLGVVPGWRDYVAGRSGMSSINVDGGGYTRNYMFGGQFRLHSVLADLWANYGWAGVALAVTMAVVLLRSLNLDLAAGRATTSSIFLAVLALWYLAFGPLFSNWLDVCVALGFCIGASADVPATDREVASS